MRITSTSSHQKAIVISTAKLHLHRHFYRRHHHNSSSWQALTTVQVKRLIEHFQV